MARWTNEIVKKLANQNFEVSLNESTTETSLILCKVESQNYHKSTANRLLQHWKILLLV